MYDDLLTGIKGLLDAANLFGSVQCGLGPVTSYPAASIWLQKSLAGSGKQDTLEEHTIMVQLQGYAGEDTEADYLSLMDLVASTRQVLHQGRLPGKGAQALTVPDIEAMRLETGGPTVYVLRVQARIMPSTFSLT
jgi:hypothetical protein